MVWFSNGWDYNYVQSHTIWKPTLKKSDFKCLDFRSQLYSDPHCIARVEFSDKKSKFSDNKPLFSPVFLSSLLSPRLVQGHGLDIRLVKTRVVVGAVSACGQVCSANVDPIWSSWSLATPWLVNFGGARIRINKQWGSESKHTWKYIFNIKYSFTISRMLDQSTLC